MLDFEIAQRIARMQERIRSATFHEIRKDGAHKSAEGRVSLAFVLPPVVGDTREPEWLVEVFSYVLGPGRNHEFRGKSALEAIAKAEDAVADWCELSEMEIFTARWEAAEEVEEDEKARRPGPESDSHEEVIF